METNEVKNSLPEEIDENQESIKKKTTIDKEKEGEVKGEDPNETEAKDATSASKPETINLIEEIPNEGSSESNNQENVEVDNDNSSDFTEIEENKVVENTVSETAAEPDNEKSEILSSESEELKDLDEPVKDIVEEEKTQKAISEEEKVGSVKKEEITTADANDIKSVDYSNFSIDDLLNTLAILVSDRPVQEIKRDLDQIKTNFYKKFKLELDKKKADFLNEGGKIEEFNPGVDAREEKLKDIFSQYKRKRHQYIQQLELSKHANLEEKFRIIEGIKGLINKEESINKTFHEFRELQNRWRSAGLVPQSKLKDLWENYHYHVEKFYDYIKINKELRDLDLKKNLETKIALCEKAESLILESNVVGAFRTLQKYHEQWREIGPVPPESKDEIWERFRIATSKINKKHQKHFEDLKLGLRRNLDAKTELCEKVEDILRLDLKAHKDWEKYSRNIISLQKTWKTIGFAPKKYNTAIYERFRKACDDFFNQKRDFYSENKELQQNNLQLKTDLCIQAEALKDSQEWKKSTQDLISLQKKWKEIGPVPRKVSDKIWKRFRAACDTFFNRKSEFYASIDQTYDENLKLKAELIGKIENYTFTENMDENFEKLKGFQKQWAEIGYVPLKQKEAILLKYRKVVDAFFDRLNIDDSRKNLLKFKNKLEGLESKPGARGKLFNEREKYITRLKKLESDIVLWENNIGFFADSEGANSMKEEISKKIDQAKVNLKNLQEKIKLIDNL